MNMCDSTGVTETKPKTMAKAGDSIWHRVQRASLMTRIMPATSIKPHRYAMPQLVSSPCYHGPAFNADTWVTLQAAKQGLYQGKPATFIYLEPCHSQFWKLRQTIFDVRLETGQSYLVTAPCKPNVVAYGPAYITRPTKTEAGEIVPQARCPRIQSFLTEQGARFVVSASTQNDRGILEAFKIGLVIVHEQPAELKIFPSADTKVRATVARRAKVWPLLLDMGTELRPSEITCGKANGQPCSELCVDFGPEHMTAARWESLLFQIHAQAYRGSGPGESWVAYA